MPVIQMFLIGVIVLVTLVIFYFVPVGMWIQGVVSLGLGRIRIVDLIRMRLRKISPRLVTDGVIRPAITRRSEKLLEDESTLVKDFLPASPGAKDNWLHSLAHEEA